MKELNEMTREELLEIIRIKDAMIKELRAEIDLYIQVAGDLQKKLADKG